MSLLKKDTATPLLVGPILNSSGVEVTDTLVIGDFKISKNGVPADMAAPATATHDHNGVWIINLTAGNTDTPGRLEITCSKAGYAMAKVAATVLGAAAFDAIITNGATNLSVNAAKVGGTTQTGTDLGSNISSINTGMVSLNNAASAAASAAGAAQEAATDVLASMPSVEAIVEAVGNIVPKGQVLSSQVL